MIEFLQFEKKCIYNTFWNGKVGREEIYELYCIMKKWKGFNLNFSCGLGSVWNENVK